MSPTVLVEPEEMSSSQLVVEGATYRHLFRALRLRTGDPLRIVDGQGNARRGVVDSVERARASIRLGDALPATHPPIDLSVWCGALKPERATWMVEKLTELGAREVVFFAAQYSQHSYGDKQLARFSRVTRAALQQSGGSRLPRIAWVEFEQLFQRPDRPCTTFVLDLPQPSDPAWSAPALLLPLPAGAVRLVVGPEGGFSPGELELFRQLYSRVDGPEVRSSDTVHSWLPLHLGPSILRVETAAVVGSGLLLQAGSARA
jgi:16S rRNA (uracil1498-N3)-methyltransferase